MFKFVVDWIIGIERCYMLRVILFSGSSWAIGELEPVGLDGFPKMGSVG
jgi:hypothetical protein